MYKHMAKVVINILQCSLVAQTVLGIGYLYMLCLQISSSVQGGPKVIKIGWQMTHKLLKKN